jgi:hypothetical protein
MVMFSPPKTGAYQPNTTTSDNKSLLATLRTDAPPFKKVETLRWRGPTPPFAAWAERMKAPRPLMRCEEAAARIGENSIRKPGSARKRE